MLPDKDGILVKPDAAILARALVKLIENEDGRKKIAASFHQKVITRHTWQNEAKRVEAFCTSYISTLHSK